MKYGCILADPPWSFRTWSGTTGTPHRTAADHYDTETLPGLMQIPVSDWCRPDAALLVLAALKDALDHA